MSAAAVPRNNDIVREHQDHGISDDMEQLEEVYLDLDVIQLAAQPKRAHPPAGYGSQVTSLLRGPGDRLFGPPKASRVSLKGMEPDYIFHGPCGCC